MEAKAFDSSTLRGRVVVVNLTSGLARAFYRFVEREPGYVWDDVWEIPVPTDFTEGLNQYMTIINQVKNTSSNWNKIPEHLSLQGYANSYPIPDLPFQVPTSIATSVTELFPQANGIHKQLEISLLLRVQCLPTFFTQLKASFWVLVTKQPIEVTVIFDDLSQVKFAMAGGQLSSIAFIMLSATAIDSDKKPIYQNPPNYHGFPGGGADGGNYFADKEVLGISIRQSCKTYWTNSGAGWVGQILCLVTQIE